jgi:predicted component of type VI protein secretion system
MRRSALAIAIAFLCALIVSACADSSSQPKKHPPQDPPDYHGVPTDMTPPSMNTPSTPSQ